jgi:exodeoxyribonuclease VII large subunit
MEDFSSSESELVWSVTDFIAVFNQTIDFAYPLVCIEGELSNFRVSKNKWVYFDLKDSNSSLKFFGSVYALPGPLEEGMKVVVRGNPRLHNLFGFSINFNNIRLVGEGSIKKAQSLLMEKLEKEGLFDESRKRYVPYPPNKIGLVVSLESAAYHDFVKVISHRWGGLKIFVKDVQVQGEAAALQIVESIQFFNANDNVDAIVLIRGGGSADDLASFSDERVVRAVALSRVPTVVAIGHEIDISLAELAADLRASTPSNAAELLTPDRRAESALIKQDLDSLNKFLSSQVKDSVKELLQAEEQLANLMKTNVKNLRVDLSNSDNLTESLNPMNIINRGYSVLRNKDGKIIKSTKDVNIGDSIMTSLKDGVISSKVTEKSK